MPGITTGFWGGNKVLFGIHKGRAASMSILLEDHHLKSVSDAMLATNTMKKRQITCMPCFGQVLDFLQEI